MNNTIFKDRACGLRKEIYYLLLVGLMILTFCISYTKSRGAKTDIMLDYWYSEQYKVGYWSSEPRVWFQNLSTSFSVVGYLSNAVTKWDKAGINCSITTVPNYAVITYYGGTQAQLNLLGFTYTSTTAGNTRWERSDTVEEKVYYNYYERTVEELKLVIASTCSEAGSDLYQTVTLHEMGHALGWYGHEASSNAVMFKEPTSVTLTDRDINQILQIYKIMN